MKLAFQPGDATWTKMREKGKSDLYFLAHTILGYGEKIPMRRHAHDLLCRVAQGTTGCPEIDHASILKLLLPRGWGKTSVITISQTLQYLIQDPETSVLLCNEREQNAKDFLTEIKYQIQGNELFRALYPELVPPSFQDTEWSGTRITVPRKSGRKEPSVFVIGVGGTVTGMHPDHIIVDDMISREAAENARRGAWQIMEEVNRWTHTLEALLSQRKSVRGHRICIIGTRWFFSDCYDHLDLYFGGDGEEQEWLLSVPVEGGKKQTMPVKLKGRMATFMRSAIEDGQSSFPEKWSLDDLAQLQAGDPILFSANFLNNPASSDAATFKPEWLKTYTWLDPTTVKYVNSTGQSQALNLAQCDIVILVDPGGFGARRTEDRARSAIWVVGHTPNGEYLLLDCWSDKDTYLVAQQRLVSLVKRYRPRKLGVEVEGQQRVFYDQTKELVQATGLPLAVEELHTEGKNKDDRILQLEPYFQRGVMYIGTGAVFTEFRTQYSQFPRSARRDLLDALAYLPRLIKPRLPGLGTGPDLLARKHAQLTAYYQRRGMSPPGGIPNVPARNPQARY